MSSKKIQGVYDLYLKCTDAAYTLTGNDRNADFGFVGTQDEIPALCLNYPGALNTRIAVPVENKVIIKKMKLWPRGAYGLQHAPLYMAGSFYLELGRTDTDTNTFVIYDKVAIYVPNWGEWFDVNAVLEPYKRIDGDSSKQFLQFSMAYDTAVFTCDDFNIQSDFVGQGVSPALEMIVDTAGLVDSTNGVYF